jgi:hypothetical protein
MDEGARLENAPDGSFVLSDSPTGGVAHTRNMYARNEFLC